MSAELFCCLCCTSAIKEYKYLQNDYGKCTEVYEITVKYFNPELLTEYLGKECSKKKSVLCQNCWVHIQDFHDFQQTVVETRLSLDQIDIKALPLQIKVEKDQVTTVSNDYDTEIEFPLPLKVNEEHINTVTTDIDNEAKTSLEHVRINRPPLHVKVGEFQVTTLFNNYGNETEASFNEIAQLKSPLHIKLEESQITSVSNDVFISNELNLFEEDVKRDVDVKKPLHRLRKRNKKNDLNTQENFKSGQMRAIKLNSAKYVKIKEFDEFISEWKPQLECDICGDASFPIFELLKVHFQEKHNAKVYVKCCGHKFNLRCRLVEHIRLHLNPEIHKCDICGKLNGSKNSLIRHKKTIHEKSQKFKCSKCPKICNLKHNLNNHLLTHLTGSKDFKCNQCDKAFVTEIHLKKHMLSVHTERKKKNVGIEKPKFRCEECGAELGNRIALKCHKASYHNDGSTVYVCSLCGKFSSSERALNIHKKYVHEVEKNHKCPLCDKAYKHTQNLQQHVATHT